MLAYAASKPPARPTIEARPFCIFYCGESSDGLQSTWRRNGHRLRVGPQLSWNMALLGPSNSLASQVTKSAETDFFYSTAEKQGFEIGKAIFLPLSLGVSISHAGWRGCGQRGI